MNNTQTTLIIVLIIINQNLFFGIAINSHETQKISPNGTKDSFLTITGPSNVTQGVQAIWTIEFQNQESEYLDATLDFINETAIFGFNLETRGTDLVQTGIGKWNLTISESRSNTTIPGMYNIEILAYPVNITYQVGQTYLNFEIFSIDKIAPFVSFEGFTSVAEGAQLPGPRISFIFTIEENYFLRHFRLFGPSGNIIDIAISEGSLLESLGLTYNSTYVMGNYSYKPSINDGEFTYTLVAWDFGYNNISQTWISPILDHSGPELEILSMSDVSINYEPGDEFTIEYTGNDFSPLKDAVVELDFTVYKIESASSGIISFFLPDNGIQKNWILNFYITDAYDQISNFESVLILENVQISNSPNSGISNPTNNANDKSSGSIPWQIQAFIGVVGVYTLYYYMKKRNIKRNRKIAKAERKNSKKYRLRRRDS